MVSTEGPDLDDSLENWMELYLAGDPAAFEAIYRHTAPRVRAWLRRRVSDSERVEEILQKIFLKFHQSRHQYRAGEVVEAWLFSIVRSSWIDHLRSEKRRPDLSRKVNLEDAPQEALMVPQTQEALERGEISFSDQLSFLNEGQREAIELRYAAGESFESLARRWNVSESSARQRVSRAVRALRAVPPDGSGKGELR